MDSSPQAPLSMGFPRQEYWSGQLFPPPGDLPHPGTEPRSLSWAGRFFTAALPGRNTISCFKNYRGRRGRGVQTKENVSDLIL